MEGSLRHLIVAANPSGKSFNHSVVETYAAALRGRAHPVVCRDIYATGFNPILSARIWLRLLAAGCQGTFAPN
jgi:NAD(P)H dehydrogenase (quinone)